jgi:hypothetical protein
MKRTIEVPPRITRMRELVNELMDQLIEDRPLAVSDRYVLSEIGALLEAVDGDTPQSELTEPIVEVSWCVQDILDRFPDWTPEHCREFLETYEDTIQTDMIDRGWRTIDSCAELFGGPADEEGGAS